MVEVSIGSVIPLNVILHVIAVTSVIFVRSIVKVEESALLVKLPSAIVYASVVSDVDISVLDAPWYHFIIGSFVPSKLHVIFSWFTNIA